MPRPRLARTLAALFALLASGGLTGCDTTSDLGPEFAEIKPEESQVVFAHPSMAGGSARFFKGRDRNRGGTIYTGSWRPARSEYPIAQLSLLTLPPGYFFNHSELDSDLIRNWSGFKDRPFTIEEKATVINSLGRVTSQRFKSENVSCVAFAILFGNMDYGAGTRRLDGLYCLPPGAVMTQDNAEAVIRAVTVKA